MFAPVLKLIFIALVALGLLALGHHDIKVRAFQSSQQASSQERQVAALERIAAALERNKP